MKRRGQRGRAETGLHAVIKSLFGEFLDREAAEGGGREAVRTEEGEKDGKDFRIPVDEDRVIGSAVGKGS